MNCCWMKLGTNYLDDKHSTLLSWTLKKDYQFLIEGSKAHLIFKAFSSTDQPTNKGFQIYYNVTGEHQLLLYEFINQLTCNHVNL